MPDPRDHADAEQLADLLEGVLPDAEAATVAAHLDTCASCAETHAQLAALPALLAATPVPAMPADVAARIEAALAVAASERRRPALTTPSRSPHPGIVQARRRRGERVRRWAAGAVAVAAAVVAVSLVGDLVGGVSAPDEATSDASGTADDGMAEEAAGSARGPDESADDTDARLARALPDLDAGDFGADVEQLYDSGTLTYGLALDAAALHGGAPAGAEAPSGPGGDGTRAAAGAAALARSTCPVGDLRAAGVRGVLGTPVLVDGTLARLVGAGPAARREVAAYSCAGADRLASATLDLRR